MSYESLTLFQCLQVDEGEYRMRNDLEFGCYSGNHILWIFIIAVPMLAIWVFGSPILVLTILVKNRDKLTKGRIKDYFYLLYQGLKPNRFYWEFVNTLRKIIILGVNVMLFSFKTEYRILFGTGKCLLINT